MDCSIEARSGVRFDLRLTEKYLCYSRINSFTFRDPLETVTVERSAITDVELKKKSPIVLRTVGVLLVAATTLGVLGLVNGTVDHMSFKVLLGYPLGGACFLSSGNRWQLSFSDGKKRHRLVQPVASDRVSMTFMADSLQKAGQLLRGYGSAILR